MKKVVRLTEGELNRLVKKIVNEAPINLSGLERYTDADFDGDDGIDKEKFDRVTKGFRDAISKYEEFQKNGIQMNEGDVSTLLFLAKMFCSKANMGPKYGYASKCSNLERIENYVDDIHSQNFSKKW